MYHNTKCFNHPNLSLADRAGGKLFSQQFEDAVDRLDEFVVALEKEVELRAQLVELLEKSEIFYEAQMGEARIVANVSTPPLKNVMWGRWKGGCDICQGWAWSF